MLAYPTDTIPSMSVPVSVEYDGGTYERERARVQGVDGLSQECISLAGSGECCTEPGEPTELCWSPSRISEKYSPRHFRTTGWSERLQPLHGISRVRSGRILDLTRYFDRDYDFPELVEAGPRGERYS